MIALPMTTTIDIVMEQQLTVSFERKACAVYHPLKIKVMIIQKNNMHDIIMIQKVFYKFVACWI